MILFHSANAPGGVYLGLFLKRDLHAPDRMLAYAFVVSMVAWMLIVWPAGASRTVGARNRSWSCGWTIMAVRLAVVAAVGSPELAVVNQTLDGLANGLFAVVAAAWVTDRLADPRRSRRSAGDRRLVPCFWLGDRPGGGQFPRRPARLPRVVSGTGWRRCTSPH